MYLSTLPITFADVRGNLTKKSANMKLLPVASELTVMFAEKYQNAREHVVCNNIVRLGTYFMFAIRKTGRDYFYPRISTACKSRAMMFAASSRMSAKRLPEPFLQLRGFAPLKGRWRLSRLHSSANLTTAANIRARTHRSRSITCPITPVGSTRQGKAMHK